MNGFKHLFDFLERLQQNNHKEWMDAHRKEYFEVRDLFIDWLDRMNLKLSQIDPGYFNTPGRKAINRINNNLLFHPNKPVYKDHFAGGLDQVSKQGDFYIELGLNACFMGGGYWHPSSKFLKSIREAIDYNGEELVAILNKKSFKKMFGGMVPCESLKQPPRGYSNDHPHIDLLKQKSFAAGLEFSKAAVFKDDFEDWVVEVYRELLPFRRYLNEAVSV